MLRILIVEDDLNVASMLRHIIEENMLFSVVGVVDDAESAVRLASEVNPDIALVDLKLARGTTGFAAAAKLQDLGVMCLFVTGKAPDFAMADLAIGCLAKPFTTDDLHVALSIAESKLYGRIAFRTKLPSNLTLYEDLTAGELQSSTRTYEPALIRSRRSLKMRVIHWVIGLGRD